MAFKLTPESLGLMSGGLNMMAASRGGNPDLTKGGLGYALQQGLQGGLQGMQLGTQMQEQAKKRKMMDDMLMKLNIDPSAQQSTGVMRPDVQQSALTKLTPEQKEVARMAIMSGDWKTISNMLSPDQGMTPYQRESLKLQRERLNKVDQPNTEVQSSTILPDGTVQLVRKDGTVEIVTQDQANKEIVAQAQEYGAELQGRRSQERTMGAGTADIALKSFDKIGDIRQNVSSLKEVINLVGEGAQTGPIADKLPNFRAATIKLNTLKNQLGLDVVGSVTFGALSEGELKLALDTALPTNLEGPALVEWATKKAEAQEKLANNLEQAAVFLSNPNNKLSDWIELKKKERESAKTSENAPQGVPPEVWAVMTSEEKAAWQ